MNAAPKNVWRAVLVDDERLARQRLKHLLASHPNVSVVGEAADLAVIGLMLAALSFAASFFVISLACDYRYLYLLDLAALVGLVYWALDPPPLKLKPPQSQ